MTITINITKRTSMLLLAALIAVAVVLGVGACSNKQQQVYNDAPRTGVNNTAPADIIAQPDGFSNVAAKCDGPNRVYSAYHGDGAYGSVAVVANDPRCTGAKS